MVFNWAFKGLTGLYLVCVLGVGRGPATDRLLFKDPYQQPQTRIQAPKSGGLEPNGAGRAMAWNNFKIKFSFNIMVYFGGSSNSSSSSAS
jgi:hypothetical protein